MLRLLLHLLAPAVALVGAMACASNDPASDRPRSGPLVSSLQVEILPDSVRFVLQVTNASREPVDLDFFSGQSFDFVVLDGEREVWRWSADRMFTQALRTETLAPDETRTYTASWDPPAGLSGQLVARGFLTARGVRAEEQTYFVLP